MDPRSGISHPVMSLGGDEVVVSSSAESAREWRQAVEVIRLGREMAAGCGGDSTSETSHDDAGACGDACAMDGVRAKLTTEMNSCASRGTGR